MVRSRHGADISTRFLLQSPLLVKLPNKACHAPGQQPRTGLRAHDQPAVGLPALPEPARGRRRPDDLVAGAGRAVSPERRADPQGPGVLRRVRRARRRLLRQAISSGICGRFSASIASCASPSWAPATWASRSPTIPGFRQEGFEIAALFDNSGRQGRPAVARRRADPRHPRPEEAREAATASASRSSPCRRRPPSTSSIWSSRPASRPCSTSRPARSQVPADVKLKSVDLTVSLESLSFYLAQGERWRVGRRQVRPGAARRQEAPPVARRCRGPRHDGRRRRQSR